MSGNKDQGRAEVHEARLTALTMFSSPETRPQDESLVAAKKFAWKLAVSQRSASEGDLVTLEPRKVQWTYPKTGDVWYRSWIDRQIERLTRINRREILSWNHFQSTMRYVHHLSNKRWILNSDFSSLIDSRKWVNLEMMNGERIMRINYWKIFSLITITFYLLSHDSLVIFDHGILFIFLLNSKEINLLKIKQVHWSNIAIKNH